MLYFNTHVQHFISASANSLFSNTHLFTELEETKVLENSGIGD